MNTLIPASPQTQSAPARPRESWAASWGELDGVRLGVAHVVLALVLLGAAALALPGRAGLVLVALLAIAGGFELTAGFAALFGFSCWACYTGFVENGLGQLTLLAPDLQRLAALVGLALAGVLAHRLVRRG